MPTDKGEDACAACPLAGRPSLSARNQLTEWRPFPLPADLKVYREPPKCHA